MRKDVISVLGDPPKWRVLKDSFAGKNANVFKLFEDKNYRPTTKW